VNWDDVLQAVVTLLAVVLTAATPLVVRAVLRWLSAKTAIAVSKADEEQLTEQARLGVAWAEERAHEAIKHRRDAHNPPETTGVGKLSAAVQYVREERERVGKNALTDPEIARRVQAELRRVRGPW
jgi:uncharacterized protein YlxP (DUF503 family)